MYSSSQFISIHGLSLHYRLIRPDGEPRHRVLLIPSPGLSTFCWRYIVPELTAAGCLCVLCDLPGFGLSECRADVPQDHETRARFLWGLLDSLDLQEGGSLNYWHLMAHGSACGTIAAMALTQPDSVASLFMVAPVLYSPLPRFLYRMAQRPGFERVIHRWFRRNLLDQRRFARLTTRLYGCPLPDRILAQLRRPLMRLAGQDVMLRRLLLDGYRTRVSQLNDLFMPCMVLWGGRDPVLGGEIPKKLRMHDLKNAEYHILSAAGHCPMETNSQAVRDFLRGWIREMW